MAKLFRTREFFYKYPWLDALRLDILAGICNYGTKAFDCFYRRMRVISPGAQPYVDQGKPVIYAVYHGCMIALLGFHPRKKLTVLVSASRDGEIIARACLGLGFLVARGSTGRRGVSGALEMIEAAEQGQSLAMLVDGPKGPLHEVKAGVVKLAQVSGLPIIPIGLSSRSPWRLRSWDRFFGCAWGGPIATFFGDPIFVPRDSDSAQCEAIRLDLEERMKVMQVKADATWTFTDERNIQGFIG